eukprot:CAMPEP_0170560374 /NCGR_PEP_ID=MMETSP0211-20121228/48527_1 /TAXON_ID=311385 /ORGANISM="Pseudokeronopsis sp., Strain OXSARD2" /LENGTH=117 /DNA_ID=CAMNT_0010874475 /DNA_START=129 /DNA_END=485 /DNA_ORIENTATION=-
MEDMNSIFNDVISWYPEELVSFYRVDGILQSSISKRFGVSTFPTLLHVWKEDNITEFGLLPRNYDNYKKWILSLMGQEALKEGVSIPKSKDAIFVENVQKQIEEIITVANKQSQLST